MLSPLVSVVIPAHNAASYISRTIESVISQTFTAWELLVVDDGSTDNTPQILTSLSADPRIRILFQHNQGSSAARNAGLLHSTAPFVGFLDADDIWYPTFLERLVAALEARPDSPLACAGWRYIDATGQELPQAPIQFPPDMHQLQQDLLWRNAILPSAALVRTESVRACGGFDGNLLACEDWDLWLRLRSAGSFVSVPYTLALYRVYGFSKSDRLEEIEQAQLRLNQKHLGSIDGPPSSWSALKQRAVGHTYFVSGLQYLRSGRPQTGLNKVRQALQVWPTLIEESEFYYELACAFQARGYRGSVVGLRLRRSAFLMRRLLTQSHYMRNWPIACTTLSQIAWSVGMRRTAADFALQALCWPTPDRKMMAVRALVRAITPQWVLNSIRTQGLQVR